MRVLLTGGTDFIGSHMADCLLERGYEVAVVDDLSSGKRENVPDGARFYEMDVGSGCAGVFEDFEPEALCHQAAQMDVRRSVREPDFDADVNVLGTVRLLENCIRYGVGRGVFASTGGAVYGEQHEFLQKATYNTQSPPTVSRSSPENVTCTSTTRNTISRTLRCANVYGPRQDPHGEAGVVAIYCGNLAANRQSTINGTGEQTRDYVYVEDVARANVLVLEKLEVCGKDLQPGHGAAKPVEQSRSAVDPSLAAGAMGWRPEVDLARSLAETLRFFGAI